MFCAALLCCVFFIFACFQSNELIDFRGLHPVASLTLLDASRNRIETLDGLDAVRHALHLVYFSYLDVFIVRSGDRTDLP